MLRTTMYYEIETIYIRIISLFKSFSVILYIFNDTLMTMTGYCWYSFGNNGVAL